MNEPCSFSHDDFSAGFRVNDCGDHLEATLLYPGDKKRIKSIEVSLSSVRAADSVRLSYDFDRDGWVIKQASRFSWAEEEWEAIKATGGDPEDWQEVAFIQAWAREEEDHDD